MKPEYHISVSLISGAFLVYYLNSWVAGISCLLSGVLIDLDHVIDYFLEKKKIPFDYKELSDYCKYDKEGKLYLIFHSVEYVIVLVFVIFRYPNNILLGIFWGVGLHLLCDQFSNPLRPLGYFLFYRMKNNFNRRYIFTKEYVYKTLQLS